MSGQIPKPPIGVMPQSIWRQRHRQKLIGALLDRRDELLAAVGRYRVAECEPSPAWLDEIDTLQEEITLYMTLLPKPPKPEAPHAESKDDDTQVPD